MTATKPRRRDAICACGGSPCFIIAESGPLCVDCERRTCVTYVDESEMETGCEVAPWMKANG